MNGTPIFGPDAYQHPAVETPAKKRSHAHHIAEKDYRKRLQQALSKLRSVCCAGSDVRRCELSTCSYKSIRHNSFGQKYLV